MTHFYGVENVVIVNILSFCHTTHMWNELHAMARRSTCACLCFWNLNIRKCFGHLLGAADASLHASVYFSARVPRVCHECGKSVEVTKLIFFMRKKKHRARVFVCFFFFPPRLLLIRAPSSLSNMPWHKTVNIYRYIIHVFTSRAIVCRPASTLKVDKNRSH